jgi:hypothetical protein
MNSNIGDKIKTMRQGRGFTQLALAKKSGGAQSTLSQYLYLPLLGSGAAPVINTSSACESEISI